VSSETHNHDADVRITIHCEYSQKIQRKRTGHVSLGRGLDESSAVDGITVRQLTAVQGLGLHRFWYTLFAMIHLQ